MYQEPEELGVKGESEEPGKPEEPGKSVEPGKSRKTIRDSGEPGN